MKLTLALLAGLLVAPALRAAPQALPPPWLPFDPGAARCEAGADGASLRNGALRFAVAVREGGLVPAALLAGTEPPDARASADGGNAGSGLKT